LLYFQQLRESAFAQQHIPSALKHYGFGTVLTHCPAQYFPDQPINQTADLPFLSRTDTMQASPFKAKSLGSRRGISQVATAESESERSRGKIRAQHQKRLILFGESSLRTAV
jgi:hypothetical protein